ncbi:MAG: glycosyl hydrolase family 18 protein [Patescibacteria group bacterium]
MKLQNQENQKLIYAIYGITGVIIIALIVYLRNFFIKPAQIPLKPVIPKGEISAKSSPRPFKIRGSIPYWDQYEAFKSFNTNTATFNSVSLFWYFLDEQEGGLRKYTDAVYDPQIIEFAHKNGAQVSAVITNLPEAKGSTWDSNRVERILDNTKLRNFHIQEIKSLIVEKGFDGVTIDYEEIDQREEDSFTLYIAELVETLRPLGKFVGVALHPKLGERSDRQYSFQNWERLAPVADELYIMAYGEHWDEGRPGPIASAEWVGKIVAYLKQLNVPLEKFYLGIPLYGYDWNKDSKDKAKGLTYRDVKRLMEQYDIGDEWGEDTPAPFFQYKDENGDQHEVWFENGPSVEVKVQLAREAGFGGVTFWRLGGEDPEVWERVRKFISTPSAQPSQPSAS